MEIWWTMFASSILGGVLSQLGRLKLTVTSLTAVAEVCQSSGIIPQSDAPPRSEGQERYQ